MELTPEEIVEKYELTNELKVRFEMLYYGQRVSMLHKPHGEVVKLKTE